MPRSRPWCAPPPAVVQFAADDPVLTPEMEPTHAFLLVEGHVRRAAGILPEATYGAGTLFGARALLSARATSTSVALDEVRAWQIPKATLQSLLSANPAFCAAVFAEIARRLSKAGGAQRAARVPVADDGPRARRLRAQALLRGRRARPGVGVRADGRGRPEQRAGARRRAHRHVHHHRPARRAAAPPRRPRRLPAAADGGGARRGRASS